MNLWDSFLLCSYPGKRSCRLRLHFDPGIDAGLRSEYIGLARWLRRTYRFPSPLNVYIVNSERIRLESGRSAYGSFKCYDGRPPIIKIPSAIDASKAADTCILDEYNAILSSFIHELTHYFQWAKGLEQSNAVSERQANYYRYRILDSFYRQTGIVPGFE